MLHASCWPWNLFSTHLPGEANYRTFNGGFLFVYCGMNKQAIKYLDIYFDMLCMHCIFTVDLIKISLIVFYLGLNKYFKNF